MTKLPIYLKQGDDARLIPVAKDSNTEVRLLSPVLAAMCIVPEFARILLNPLSAKLGKTTKVRALTEVVFSNDRAQPINRPDGLILVTTGKREFRLLVEAKAKNASLSQSQVESYLKLARDERIDAVLTISNDFAANPKHSPLTIRSTFLRKVNLFHLSWSMILTHVDLLLNQKDIEDNDRVLIMRELQRYLSHGTTGVSGFTQMNRSWRDLVKAFSSGTPPSKNDPQLLETITAWHQEQKDLCLILSRKVGRHVTLKLPRKSRDDAQIWQKESLDQLLLSNTLHCELDVPDAPSPVFVKANLARKTISISIKLKAPADRKSARARSNWLLRQLNNVADPRIQMLLHYPGKKPARAFEIIALRNSPEKVDDDSNISPNFLEVRLHDGLAGDFSGSKKFIERLEECLSNFYSQAVAGVKPWTPAAPKPLVKQQFDSAETEQKPSVPFPGDLN
ncbi:MAG: hypothetical protein L3J21_09145 [Devosiaceae bacterium]|nr:hypothetical protein [Devosiaceae bacterium]